MKVAPDGPYDGPGFLWAPPGLNLEDPLVPEGPDPRAGCVCTSPCVEEKKSEGSLSSAALMASCCHHEADVDWSFTGKKKNFSKKLRNENINKKYINVYKYLFKSKY